MAEEVALFVNASSSSKAKVSNVNIHVELGAYDRSLYDRQRPLSAFSNNVPRLSAKLQNSEPSLAHSDVIIPSPPAAAPSSPPPPPLATTAGSSVNSEKVKRKRHHHHHHHHLTPKTSKWEEEREAATAASSAAGNVQPSSGNGDGDQSTPVPVYVFVNNDYRDRALAHVSNNDAALRTLTSVKIRVRDHHEQDQSSDLAAGGGDYLKRETSV